MKNKDKIVNGNMANTFEELKMLGKQMEHMRDEQQLEEQNRISDPQQFDNEESMEKK
ncbi:MAG: multidrug ABC transporter ATPase [Solibacillus sp.]